jgi:hypothetical protein
LALRDDLSHAVQELSGLANGFFKYLKEDWGVVVIPTQQQALKIAQ